jgi:hypothetical protein
MEYEQNQSSMAGKSAQLFATAQKEDEKRSKVNIGIENKKTGKT